MAPVKERVNKFRQKLTEDQKIAAREKDKMRKRKARELMSHLKKKQASRLSAERVKKQRMMKKIGTEISSVSPNTAYHSSQALGKAVAKVKKQLPISPKKKVAVISKIATEIGIESRKRNQHHTSDLNENVTHKVVKDFYERDDISWQAPGRKDTIITRINGEKVKLQKKHLCTVLTEVYQLFRKENPNIKIGFSTFASLRPSHILLISETPHNVCVCSQHANIDFLLYSINKVLPEFPRKSSELVEWLVCDKDKEDCMLRNCTECKYKFQSWLVLIENGPELLNWYAWDLNSEKRMVKTVIEGTVNEAFLSLSKKIPHFLNHVFIKQKQRSYFQECKKALSEQSCVLQVDFSENFTIMHQDEVQSAHWSNNQVTIYTAVAYTTTATYSYAIISDYLQHDKLAVHCFNEKLFQDLKKKHPELKQVDIFSDGAAQHFKQRFTLCNMTYGLADYGLQLNWHFFATSHGKGAVDGVGGMVKHHVWQKIKARKAFVCDALSFSRCAASTTSKVNIIYVSEEEIKSNSPMLEKRWENIKRLPHTQEVHCVRTERQDVVMFSTTSDRKGQVFRFNSSNGDSSELETFSEPTSSPTYTTNEISFGKWVVVQFTSAHKSNLKFVGQVIGLPTCSTAEVKFLKKYGEKFVWPSNEDVAVVDRIQIKKNTS